MENHISQKNEPLKYIPVPPGAPQPEASPRTGKKPWRLFSFRNLIKLIALIVVLFGVGGYFSMSDMSYASKCQNAYETLQDVQVLTKGVKDLPGDPESNVVKSYVAKLDDAEVKLDKLADELADMHVGKKNEARNRALVEAIRLERSVLDDVETLLQHGAVDGLKDVATRVDNNLNALQSKAAALDFDNIDFASVMDITSLDEDVTDYLKRNVQKQKEDAQAEAQKTAEETQKAQQAAAKQQADANAKRQEKHQEIQNWNQKSIAQADAAGEATFVAVNIHYDPSENAMEFSGYLYNGTGRTLRGHVTVTYTVYLYKAGEVIETDDRSSGVYLQQPLAPHQKAQKIIANLAGPNAANGYDDFYVECRSVQ